MSFFFSPVFKTMVLLPKFTGAFSITGSCAIIHDILFRGDRRKKMDATSTRILMCLCFSDIVYTFMCHILGTWMVPVAGEDPNDPEVFLAAGNQASCVAQGFLGSTAGETSILYNAVLAITYVLVVRFGYKEPELRKGLPKFCLFVFPVLFNLLFAIWPLMDQAYNLSLWACYIQEYPLGCVGEDCIRGANALSINFAQSIVTLICMFVVLASVIILWRTMYVQEKAMSRYNTSGEQTSSSTRELSKKVGRQGMAYSGCFFLSWSPWIVITFMQFAKAAVPPGVGVFASCMLPLQDDIIYSFAFESGAFNAYVYFRPRMVAKKERSAKSSVSSQSKVSKVSKTTLHRGSSALTEGDGKSGTEGYNNEEVESSNV